MPLIHWIATRYCPKLKRAPLLYPYALSCYQQPTLLFGDGFEFHSHSTSGGQQGDVCGPVLFALALHRVVLQLQELGLHYQFWYLDDGIICGPAGQIALAVSMLQSFLSGLHLELNRPKCKLFGHGAASLRQAAFEGITRVDFSQGTTVLGVPVGSDSFVEQEVDPISRSRRSFWSRSPHFPTRSRVH